MKDNLVLIIIGIALGVAGAYGYQSIQSEPVSESVMKTGLFINIHTGPGDNEDNHRLAMSLKTAAMAAKSGKDVYVMFDTNGIDHVVQSATDATYSAADGTSFSVQTLIDEALAAGVTIAACPMCLAAKGYLPEDVREGVTIHKLDNTFNFTEGGVVSLSY